MNRYQFEDTISAYIENELSLAKRKEFKKYIEEHPDAKALVNAIKSNIKRLESFQKFETKTTFNDELLNKVKKISVKKITKNKRGLVFGFTPLDASLMTGFIIAIAFISIQLFYPEFNFPNSANDNLAEGQKPVISNSINKKSPFSPQVLVDVKGDSIKNDSIKQSKRDFSDKIQFVND